MLAITKPTKNTTLATFIKLIKYNLKPILKNILPYVILMFSSVILFTVTSYDTKFIDTVAQDGQQILVDAPNASELQQFVHGLASFLISCSLILLFAITVKAIVQRFKNNFYSDEAYLTHTLPIPRNTLWNAQICTVFITIASVIITLILNCLILALTRDGQQLLESFGLIGGCTHCFGEYFSVEPLSPAMYLSYGFLIFIELSFLALCCMFSIILKNHFHKTVAMIAGLGVYIIGSCLLLYLVYLIGFFDPAISQLLNGFSIATPGYIPDNSFMARALFYIGAIYTCYCVTLYFVNKQLLQRGINLD